MSSLKDLASLIMVPSMYKDGRLDTVKPLGNSILHPDATGNNDGTDGSTPAEGNFTFSRGSNLAATRVDVNGLIEKGRENTTTYSQDATQWSGQKASQVSATKADPFGGNNAAEYEVSSTTGASYFYRTISPTWSSGQVVTGSVYIKDVDQRYVQLTFGTAAFGGSQYQNFDLQTGTKGTGLGMIDSTITSVGNGWYRLSITKAVLFNGASGVVICFVPSASAARLEAPSTSGLSLQAFGIQTEQGLVATDYIETGASTAQAGILEDMPRLDYSGGASCPSLLLEPQRSNIVTQSDANADWNMVANVTNAITKDVLSPEGVYNAWSATRNINTSGYTYMTSLSLSPNTTYTASIWLKAADLSVCNEIVFNFHPNSFAGKSTKLSFEDGSVTGDGIVETYPNGWYRISLTSTSNSSIGYFDVGLQPLLNDSVYWGGSDGDVLWYAYGTQVEVGSYPTSYIPTYGSSVTRSQEYGRTPLSGYEVNEEQGVIFAEFEYLGGTDFQVVSMHNGGSIVDWLMVDAAGKLRGSVFYNGAYQVSMDSSPTTLSPNTYYKAAFKYESGNNVLYLNGVKVGTNTQTFTNPPTLGYVQLGGFWQLSNTNVNCKLKQALLFNTSLTDAELAALTTL